MPIYEFEGKRPQIAASSYVAPTACVIGDVIVGERVYIAAGVVLRGDYGQIVIGDGTNVQDQTICHGEWDMPVLIGKNNHIGHRAIIHCASIGDQCLIGMGSIILDASVIEDCCIIGAGALLTRGTHVPSRKLFLGMPGKVRGDVSDEQAEEILAGVIDYQRLIERSKTIKQID